MTYALSAGAPLLCILLGKSWQALAWWSLAGAVTLIAHVVQKSITQGEESIRELEKMKYVAPGA